MNRADPGFVPGLLLGGLLAAAGLWLGLLPFPPEALPAAATSTATVAAAGTAPGTGVADTAASLSAADWIVRNLGHSVWAFGGVLALWGFHVARLSHLLGTGSGVASRSIVQLDQLSDVWAHLFVGIGVIWTAVGMRAALQTTLGDPESALSDSAGSVLRNLVDGGILLALTTTIVGAVGGYLLRVGKTLWVGAALHAHYDTEEGRELRELLHATQRIESSLLAGAGDSARASTAASGIDLESGRTADPLADTQVINEALRGSTRLDPAAVRRIAAEAQRRHGHAAPV